jgi:hypothetical protein
MSGGEASRLGSLRCPRRALFVVAVATLLAAPTAHAASPSQEPNANYIVFQIARKAMRPVFAKAVRLAVPPTGRGEEALARVRAVVSRENSLVDVRLVSSDGQSRFHDVIAVPRWVRAELPREGASELEGKLEPTRSSRERRAFTVRVPILPGARLRLADSDSGAASDFGVDEIVNDSSLELTGRVPEGRLAHVDAEPTTAPGGPSPGSPANRVDLLVMGDGYTAAQAGAFANDAAQLSTAFFQFSPYAEYRNFVNVAWLFTASAQSGADHPPYDASCPGTDPPVCCADAEMLNDPLQGTFVSTAFDSCFCLENAHRGIYVDTALVQAAASAYPDWDGILVIVNDQTYGGAGGDVSVVSTNAASIGVARHEWGHTFTGLADEYSVSFPGYPPCSDVTAEGPACEPNVTDRADRALLKWSPWVDPSTPIPTPDAPPYLDVVGLFEGARYQTSGIYRPKDGCLMRSLASAFCEVCAQEYVLRLYRGGWGVPANGVDPIEPGSESPAPGNVNVCSGAASLSVALLQPVGGAPLLVEWLKDGVVQAGETSPSASFSVPAPGTYAIEVRVHDPTPLVRPAMAAGALDSKRSWTVTSLAPVTGDLNGSCAVDVADVFYLIDALFAGGPAPRGSGDVDGSGAVDVADVFYLINFLFAGGPPPVAAARLNG